MALLGKMCPHRTALRWLVAEVVNHVERWPGPAELRGVLCTRYDAADGIENWCALPGYRPEDGEAQSLAEHEQHKLAGPLAPGSQAIVKKLSEGLKPLQRARSAS